MSGEVICRPGVIRGRGVVRSPDGTIKAEFDFQGDCTPEEARALGLELTPHEDPADGRNAS